MVSSCVHVYDLYSDRGLLSLAQKMGMSVREQVMCLDNEWEQESEFLLFRVDCCPIAVDPQVIIIIDERPHFSAGCATRFKYGHPDV